MQRTPGPGSESRRILSASLLTAALLLAAGPPTVLAAAAAEPASEPWEGPAFAAAPAAIAQAAAAIPTGEEGVTVLLSETHYAYDAAGRETYTHRLVYKIGSASAHESWSAVEEAWSPWRQETPRLRARVITPDGAEHPLDPATIAENGEAPTSADMFEDGRLLRAPLPAITPGAVVEQEVVVREKIPFFEGGVTHHQVLAAMVAVRRARLVLELPTGVPLRWVVRRLPEVTPREEVAAGRRRLVFEARDLPPFEAGEPGLPPEVARTPYVGFSTGSSWSDLARRYSEIVDRTLAGADLRPFLRTVRVPAASQVETVGLVLARVHQEVRYTGLELGAGGLIPRTPAETLRRKFGDCKDKAVLLTGLLRALDIPAYVALLYATDGDQDVEESLPGFGVFNHAIVVVPGKPAIWIDPTDPYSRLGELPVADQGRLALIAAPSTSGLVRTPAALPSDNREIETREIYLADLGPARVVETSDYLGGSESSLRAYYDTVPADRVRESLASYVETEYQAKELTQMEASSPKDLSQPFRLRLEAAGASRGVTDMKDAAVALLPADLIGRLPDELVPDEEDADMPPRQAEYVFTQPFQAEMRYRIVPPAGFVPRDLPAARERRLGPGVLSETYAAAPDGTVTATLKLDVGKRRLSAKEFDAMRAAAGEIAQEDAVLVSFEQVGEAHLAAGRVREALAELERLSAGQPRQGLPRIRVARALLAGGLAEAARQEAERAIRLEPGLALAHRTLGWILQHDALGRRFGPGYDRAAAIAAYRKARQLDPQDYGTRADLAILLEHDARGERYSAGADLPAAIEEYRALRKDLQAGDMDDNLAVALLWAGRLQELRDLLEELDDSEQRRTLKLVAAAALDGPDTALRLAERWFSGAESLSTTLRNAAQNLLILRRYPEAAALLDRASRQSSDAAEILTFTEVLRRASRHEEMKVSLREPAGPVRRLFQVMAAGETEGQFLTPLLSRRLVQGFKESGLSPDAGLALIVSMVRRNFRSQDLPLTSALEIGLAASRDQVTGDPAFGYRVRMVSTTDSGPRVVTSFVVPEDGEYRLLTMALGFEQLGVEALDRLQQGDLRAARQWLDWAHEEIVEAPADDPLENEPLAALWQRGREAGVDEGGADEGGAEEIRCAASALALGYEATDELVGALLACRESAGESTGDMARRQALDVSLLRAYGELDRPAEAAAAADRLAAAAPASKLGFILKTGSLVQMNRDDDARRLAEERLRVSPDDVEALHVLVSLEGKAGRYDRMEELLRRIVDSGHAESEDLNTLAWMSLIQGRVDEQAIAHAQRSANLRGYGSYPSLHTLASLYAEVGKTAEAYQIILQALGTKADETPSPDDWYVFGRLAEQYGRPDLARVYYERVQREAGEPDALSTYGLAKRRLAGLGKAPKMKQAGS
jgi:tetratricopeptide (TPR) repeat protein